MSGLPDESVDLVLTDPPYITSRKSGMDKWVDHVAKQDAGHMARHKWSGVVRNLAAKQIADEEISNMEDGEYDHIDLKRGAR